MYFSMEKIDDQLIWERRGLFDTMNQQRQRKYAPLFCSVQTFIPILARDKHCILFREKWKQFAHSNPIYLTSVAILQTQLFLQIITTFTFLMLSFTLKFSEAKLCTLFYFFYVRVTCVVIQARPLSLSLSLSPSPQQS